jgi:aminoglycoside 6'-N-acetyltransferase
MAVTGLSLRPLARADLPTLAAWLAQPHVAAWWGPPPELAAVEREYGPCIDGTDPTNVRIALSGDSGLGIGMVQIYRLADNLDYQRAVGVPDAAGIDLLIGDAAHCGHGLGPRLIALAVTLAWERYPDVKRAMAGPSVRNTRSHRAFEKAGFHAVGPVAVPGEEDEEMVFVCDRPTAG